MKAMLRWEFMLTNIYIKKDQSVNYLILHLKEVQKEQIKSSLSEEGNNKDYYRGKEKQ